MSCYHPLSGYRTPGGSVTFDRSAGYSDLRVTVSCGQCWGCRLERSRQWAVRCVHEAQFHERTSFITLTYDDEQLPPGGTLVLKDWQNFAKKLRKKVGPFRFFHCGEYGENTGRPHYHAAIFGHDFAQDRKQLPKKRGSSFHLYSSETLTEIWGKGYCPIGTLTHESAAYVARYIMKKVTGDKALAHYESDQVDTTTGEVLQRKPEYTTMSRRPGIGKAWFDKYHTDVFPSDEVISRGFPSRPPKYYDYQFELRAPQAHAALKRKRVAKGRRHRDNNTPDRLRVRETVAQAKLEQLRRDSI